MKTCKNETSTTPKPTSTTSQDHVHLTCQDCGDSDCKDINDNGEVKECDEGTVGCLYAEHHGMNDLSNHNNQLISDSIYHCRARRRCHDYQKKMCQGN